MNELVKQLSCVYYERWGYDLRKLALPTQIFELTANQIACLKQISEELNGIPRFYEGDLAARSDYYDCKHTLKLEFSDIKKEYLKGFFFKIGNKSPKDIQRFRHSKTKSVFKAIADSDAIWDEISFLSKNKLPIFFMARKWIEMNPNGEWRCFIKDRKLCEIVPKLLNKSKKCPDEFQTRIHNYFGRMFYQLPSDNLIMDLYVPEDRRIILMGLDAWLQPILKRKFSVAETYIDGGY